MESMKITRGIHACVVLESGTTRAVVDAGSFGLPEQFEAATHFVFTHEHPDHVDAEAVIAHHKEHGTPIFAPPSMEKIFGDDFTRLSPGETVQIGDFSVEVVGGEHAVILESWPRAQNVGLVFDGRVYHPGDALNTPVTGLDLLLTPAGGPWFKVGDAEPFVKACAAKKVAPIHDHVLSPVGVGLNNKFFGTVVPDAGGEYIPFAPGDVIEV